MHTNLLNSITVCCRPERSVGKMQTHRIAGCPISSQLLRRFARLFVHPIMPFFVSEELRPYLPVECLVVDQHAFSSLSLPLTYRDTYSLYAIPNNYAYCAFIHYKLYETFPRDIQHELITQQHNARHNHIYPWQTVYPLIPQSRHLPALLTRRYHLPNDDVFVLDYGVWSSLPGYEQRRWMGWYLEQEQLSCCAHTDIAIMWAAMRVPQRDTIARLVGRFMPTSGPNCFAITLAAIAPSQEIAEQLWSRWVRREEFIHLLGSFGYEQQELDVAALEHTEDNVLVWHDATGTIQHAAYLVKDRLVVNKNAQAWFAPCQLVRLPELVQYWKEDGWVIKAYGR